MGAEARGTCREAHPGAQPGERAQLRLLLLEQRRRDESLLPWRRILVSAGHRLGERVGAYRLRLRRRCRHRLGGRERRGGEDGSDNGPERRYQAGAGTWHVGANINGSRIDADLAQVYLAFEYVDLTVAANRRRLYADGPVDFGPDGSAVTGNRPVLYFNDLPGDPRQRSRPTTARSRATGRRSARSPPRRSTPTSTRRTDMRHYLKVSADGGSVLKVLVSPGARGRSC